MRPDRRQLVAAGALLCLAGWAGGCATPGGPRPTARPADPDTALLFDSLSAARAKMNANPPTWVGSLEKIARNGATQLAQGGLAQSVVHDVSGKAAYSLMRNVSTWWLVTDDLVNLEWPPRLLSGRGLPVALGVALMQTTAPGRFAVIVILPEPGN